MVSSYSQLFDPIRQAWVKSTPEELVRQKLLQIMVRDLHFPKSMLAVEKELSQLPHLQLEADVPKRRLDILAFAQMEYEPTPLLMIECKATKLTPAFAQQVIGYNSFVRAPFVCLANDREVMTGFFDEEAGHFTFKPGLKSYQRLCKAAAERSGAHQQ
ncbi:MAG: hypothetical protein SP1CHLAM42_15200 [Chlamydiales bacterium]|nr:hypothetical protein [Chlamydiales bacterium]